MNDDLLDKIWQKRIKPFLIPSLIIIIAIALGYIFVVL